MSVPTLIRIDEALCRINRQAVLDIPVFTIARGEHWCAFGPNGAGKTLLAALLSGKRRESGTYVSYHQEFDPARDCLFVSFEEQQRLWQQDNRLDMSEYSERVEDRGTVVADLVHSARSLSPEPGLFEDIIAQLNLRELLHKGIRFLSSGQIRKVLIARGIYAAVGDGNKLLILDDPLESIDRDSRQRIAACIASYQDSDFASLLLCRRQQDILAACTHLAVMDELRILEQGVREQVQRTASYQAMIDAQPKIPEFIPATNTIGRKKSDDSTANLIELRHVSASYGDLQVLHDINWIMTSDDHVLIEGPNGCGKSTLLSLIDGENHKGYGQEVYLFGQRKGSGESIWDVKSHFGIVSNELHNKYVKGWKVLDVVVSGYFDSVGLYDDSGSVEWDGARAWLKTLRIETLEKTYYHEISFGQQRLVLLARAMVKHPAVLILDEPCVGLDDYHRQLILGTLSRIAEQTQTRIVYVSHVSDEEPDFATQRLRFVEAGQGGYTVRQDKL